jgi:DNA-binding NtrC family response regulator
MNPQPSRKQVVLLVDDEPDVLKSYELTLKSRQIRDLITCLDSRDVLSILEKNVVDVIVLDLMMPGISGEELLSILTERYPEIPAVIVTAVNDVETAVRCLGNGARDYLLKPVERNRFVSVVRRLLELRRLERENLSLKQSLLSDSLLHPQAFTPIITRNHGMLSIFKYIEAVAESDEPVLISGETGAGKELIARALHQLSLKKGRFVSVNVAGLDDNVFSDTLFGHSKGAFTDAHQVRSGLVEEAADGTLFLDEIGDLNPASQVKLLRLLQEKEYYALGSDKVKRTNCRVLCSTNRRLEEGIKNGTFRNDLYYRLCTHNVIIPPLRRRMDDLPLLVEHFLSDAASSLKGKEPGQGLQTDLLHILRNHDFPGNIRELRALILDAAATGSTATVALDKIIRANKTQTPDTETSPAPMDLSRASQMPTLLELEEMALREAMKRSAGNMSQAARILGVNRQTISKKLKRIGY